MSIAQTASTLRPGLLVSLKTSVRGNVSYNRVDLENDSDGKTETARWETERKIADAKEHEAALKARSKAVSLVRGVCAKSAFGLLCPESGAAKLDEAIAEGRKITDAFNATATLTRVSVYVIAGRVAPDDVEAVKAINSEIKDLLADMERGLRNCDVKVVREAANKAKNVGMMLSDEAQERVKIAIKTARDSARKIVQAGEQAAQEIDKRAIRKITEMRTAFLDLDEQTEVAKPVEQGRTLDLYVDEPVEDRFHTPEARQEFLDEQKEIATPTVKPRAIEID
jgi:hypothetical protein